MLVKEGSDVYLVDAEELETAKMDWEEAYQKELNFIASEMEELEKMEPQLSYSREDSRYFFDFNFRPNFKIRPLSILDQSLVLDLNFSLDLGSTFN